uniref:Uncharacterized protein n=1 Tax=Oryza sativa subsp. japonica TaxID=39947 RepID=Q7Y191_ORYSJ|nr:hypothetical protein [Oryza sativa Japonica Group]
MAESGFPKSPGPGLPRPGGKHGYRAVTTEVTAVFILPYPRGKPGNCAAVTAQLPTL